MYLGLPNLGLHPANVGGPSLNLDFVSTEILDSRITYSGGANGTRVNSSGVLVSASAPRFDYDPVSLAAKGLLVEEQRTNLLLQSAAFDNVSWTKGTGDSIAANDAIGPDGTLSADRATLSSIDGGIYQAFTVAASTAYTFSFYVKLGTLAAADYKFAIYDATAGAFIQQDIVPTQTPTSSGWTRVTYTFTTPVGCLSVRAYTFRNASVSAGTFWLWGAQAEAGSFATSHIPTTTAQVTRTADSVSMTGTNFSAWFNAANGTFFAEADSVNFGTSSGARVFWSADDATGNNRLTQYFRSAVAGINLDVFSGGIAQAGLSSQSGLLTNTVYKATSAYAASDFVTVVAGGTPASAASGSVPAVNQLAIGSLTNGSYLNGHIRRIRYFPTRLPNAQLQVLTQ